MKTHDLPEGWTLTTPDDYTPVPLPWRDKWIEALESGRYRKGRNILRSLGDKYCCLGVLLSLDPGIEVTKGDCYYFAGSEATVPRGTTYWDFLRDTGNIRPCCIDKDKVSAPSLASANDNGASFATIAAAIKLLYAQA